MTMVLPRRDRVEVHQLRLRYNFIHGDAMEVVRNLPTDHVHLSLTSPPYQDARLYGELKYRLRGRAWVDWCADHFMEQLRVTMGAVVWVVNGKTTKYQWCCTPIDLIAELRNRGAIVRKPLIFNRWGTPGSGGPDWFRDNYEFIICATKDRRRIPWANPTACGAPPKYGRGGRMSNRLKNGNRADAAYPMPKLANPGNVLTGVVGGGHMGSNWSKVNEAPYPEWLVEKILLPLCPVGGTVLDSFCGSGTTLAVAAKHGRSGIGIDARRRQVSASRSRVAEVLSERGVDASIKGP